MSKEVNAYGAKDSKADLEPMTIKRRDIQKDDVEIEITYCGVCHSDIHTVHNDWGNSVYPMIPGHEIIGRVISVGENVSDLPIKPMMPNVWEHMRS